jgi:hemerythrin-like domain-containing protein
MRQKVAYNYKGYISWKKEHIDGENYIIKSFIMRVIHQLQG